MISITKNSTIFKTYRLKIAYPSKMIILIYLKQHHHKFKKITGYRKKETTQGKYQIFKE